MRRAAVAVYVVVSLLSVATAPIQPSEANALDAGSVAMTDQWVQTVDAWID